MRFQPALKTCLGCLLTLLPLAAGAANRPTRSVVFILDCSHRMAAPMPTGEQIREVKDSSDPTRLDTAKDALKAELTRLSAAGNHQVAVWLFGHRLAWEDKEEPALMEQTDYLEHTLGFQVLAELLPGDDVELARPLSRLEPHDLDGLFARLDTVKAWGESPLYLAIERALDGLNQAASAADTTIVVLTDGGNQQGISKHLRRKDTVLEVAERRPVPIHFITLAGGEKLTRQSEAELRQIVSATHGSLQAADRASVLSDRIESVLDPAHAPREPRDADDRQANSTGRLTPVATTADVAPVAKPATHTLEGTIRFYGRTVKKAKITIDGGEQSTAVSDAAGRFSVERLPIGTYQLKVEAVVKNIIRTREQAVTIAPTANETVVIEVDLE
ncbi:MAG TPA: carboxypeptidase-like regulatory domain-containing protein [Pirellulales bacterium]|nr:carboxypeptidase-like regulatory domain-containing protein [Pirellulales bacterium]